MKQEYGSTGIQLEGGKHLLFRRVRIRGFIVALSVLTAQLVSTSGTSTMVESASDLSCPNGLVVRLHPPESPDASVLRIPSGLELRVSDPILTITAPMVREAVIFSYRQYDSEEERVRRTPTKTFFSVSLRLTEAGGDRVGKAIAGRPYTDLVVVCGGIALIASVVKQVHVAAIDVLVHDSAEVTERFARSLTPNVRFEGGGSEPIDLEQRGATPIPDMNSPEER
jgi:hypothetical protein